MKEYHKARVASFVILERDGKILLSRRFNTGYADGEYGLPSGHIEPNEYPLEAAIREAKEEVGVGIAAKDLECVHTSYRINKVDGVGDYVDFFFRTHTWSGEPLNQEPDKCDELVWASLGELPENVIPVLRTALESIHKGIRFSEIGR
ncbi:NUDIX domain-containing protein [soil metagenome]